MQLQIYIYITLLDGLSNIWICKYISTTWNWNYNKCLYEDKHRFIPPKNHKRQSHLPVIGLLKLFGTFWLLLHSFFSRPKKGPCRWLKKTFRDEQQMNIFPARSDKDSFFLGVPLTSWNVENKTWYSQRSTNWKVPLWHKMYAQKTCSFNPSVHPMLMRIWGGNPPNATSPKKQGLIQGVINHHSS